LLIDFLSSRRLVSDRVGTMQQTLEALTDEIALRQPGYVHIIEGLVAKLLLETARAVVDLAIRPEPLGPSLHSHAEAQVRHIVTYLRDNYQRPLSIRDVAAHAAQMHLSERHTGRLFHAVMGVCPSCVSHVDAHRDSRAVTPRSASLDHGGRACDRLPECAVFRYPLPASHGVDAHILPPPGWDPTR